LNTPSYMSYAMLFSYIIFLYHWQAFI